MYEGVDIFVGCCQGYIQLYSTIKFWVPKLGSCPWIFQVLRVEMGWVPHLFGGRNFRRLLSGIYPTIFRPKILGLMHLFFFLFVFRKRCVLRTHAFIFQKSTKGKTSNRDDRWRFTWNQDGAHFSPSYKMITIVTLLFIWIVSTTWYVSSISHLSFTKKTRIPLYNHPIPDFMSMSIEFKLLHSNSLQVMRYVLVFQVWYGPFRHNGWLW